ncbi:MAG: hypothetical protein KGI50_02945 [Patescibacteria group bacterium]|nr:hypothetical protein [Patescibacteria group bacterium]MDE2438535.1 hypothetical protein [Patescibacteria group bacterium]
MKLQSIFRQYGVLFLAYCGTAFLLWLGLSADPIFQVGNAIVLLWWLNILMRDSGNFPFSAFFIAPLYLLSAPLHSFYMVAGAEIACSAALLLIVVGVCAQQKKFCAWAWFFPLNMWIYWFFFNVPFDTIKSIVFAAALWGVLRGYNYALRRRGEEVHPHETGVLMLEVLLCMEMVWVTALLPLGYLFSPLFLSLFVYCLVHGGRYYLRKKTLVGYSPIILFTFLCMLVIVIIATQKPF